MLEYNKVGEEWRMQSLEGKVTKKIVLRFPKQICEHLILCILPISKQNIEKRVVKVEKNTTGGRTWGNREQSSS